MERRPHRGIHQLITRSPKGSDDTLGEVNPELPPEGTYDAVLASVTTKRVQITYGKITKWKDRVTLVYVFDGCRVYQCFNYSFARKANMPPVLLRLLGVIPEPGFQLERLVGTRVKLVIAHQIQNGRTWAKIKHLQRRKQGLCLDTPNREA